MTVSKKNKDIEKNFTQAHDDLRLHGTDTGSSAVQVVELTKEITKLTLHLQINKKDFSCHRSLIKKVAARKTHLKYLKKTDEQKYKAAISTLGLKR